MQHIFVSFLLFVSFSIVSAQTHRQALDDFERLKQKALEIKLQSEQTAKIILQPDESDSAAAQSENVDVFRILPREKYDKDIFKVRGGGAYYSFTSRSHSYDEIPQISLEQNYLQTGFAGANYGFMVDLGKTSLSKITGSDDEAAFMASYQAAKVLSGARIEQIRTRSFEQDKRIYKSRLPVSVGHTYLLRAVSYGDADTLVAFNIFRQDDDGSLIIFWKKLKDFEIPLLNREDTENTEKK